MSSIIEKLKELTPEHDTPVGLIHPYWARKPLNIIQELVLQFSEKGDIVIDPFVGSGTTVFAALSTGRKVIASDLNPLAVFLTKTVAELSQKPDKKVEAAQRFLNDFSDVVLPWFKYRDDLYVERERFHVEGRFENGKFQLKSTEVVLKRLMGQTLKGREVEKPSSAWMSKRIAEELRCNPVDFRKLELLPNSRIAVPSGATLAHYYDEKNQAAINLALKLIGSGKYGEDNSGVLKLLLSASFPLLRLSDKKASSQWPYWRPKENLTSRNPVVVLQKKVKAIEDAIEWLERNLPSEVRKAATKNLSLHNASVQSLAPDHVKLGKADLVLTDPPYSDQAPYLEYSSLWVQLLSLSLPADAYKHEIVQTDAPSRSGDTRDYILRLGEGLKACAAILKPSGFLIWFYQDHCVGHWAALDRVAGESGLTIREVIPMQKQRRSMKTVTSPGKTLDGDLILVFQKKTAKTEKIHRVEQGLRLIRDAICKLPASASYFDEYATVIEIGLKYHFMDILSQSFNDIRQLLKVVDRGEHVLAS